MQTFGNEERLKSKKLIERLFKEGKSFKIYPLRIIWMEVPTQTSAPVSILISVPGKNIKQAASRNLLKRRIREAYRKNKAAFYSFLEEKQRNCLIAVLYLSTEIADFKEIEEKIIYLFKRLQLEYEKTDR